MAGSVRPALQTVHHLKGGGSGYGRRELRGRRSDFVLRFSSEGHDPRVVLKHGVLETEVLAAWCNGPGRECWLDDKEPRRLLRIGSTTDGRDVAVVALVFDQDRVLIIHAMPARQVAYDYVRRSRRHER